MAWPLYFAPNLALGSSESGVAICLLWTPQDRVLPALDPACYALVGNLYSRDGISYLLRNVLARPTIRTLLLCGKDLTGSGAALVALMERGIDVAGCIVGEGTRLHPELPPEAIALFRSSVRLVDARDTMRPEAIAAALAALPQDAVPFAAPQIFPYSEPQVEALPAEDSGFVVHAPLIRDAWLRLLWHVLTFGQRSATQHSSDQSELLDVLTVVSDEPGDPTRFSYANWMPFTRNDLGTRGDDGSYTGYLAQLIEAGNGAAGVSYTYGDRLRAFAGMHDQVAAIIADLRTAGHSRRAVAALWDPTHDAGAPNPPCLTLVQARLRNDGNAKHGGVRLHLTAYFRSHDIYRAWLTNAFGLRALQAYIASQLADPAPALGDLAILSHSAHIYAHDWDAARDVLAHQYRPADPRLVRDPRGSFVISLEPDAQDTIVVRHYTPDGEHLRTMRGASARALGPQLTPFVSNLNHALYLGSELQKAEVALRLGRPHLYRQDRELELGEGSG